MKHNRRVVAAHNRQRTSNVEAALHVNNARGHTFADAARGAPPETQAPQLGGGRGWGEKYGALYLPGKAALTSKVYVHTSLLSLVFFWDDTRNVLL